MKQLKLARTDLTVSQLCLGSMTWGTQTPETDAHSQIEASLAAGINFLDTAEAYPVNPMTAEGAGRTEEIIGNWIARTGRRSELVIATKVAGSGGVVRNGAPISGAVIAQAIEASLKRLKTDYIDLYQLHWPNRGSYMFRQNWHYDPSGQDRADTEAHMEDVLAEIAKQVQAGHIRHFGLSNESAWGTAMWLRKADEMGAPRVVSVQNEYSLLCRLYDTDMAELGVNEDVALLAFSPLATGYLSGKYQGGAVPTGSRMSINDRMGGRASTRVLPATQAYLDIAVKHGLDPVQMAIAWCCQRPFPCFPIFGATTMTQLQTILDGRDLVLDGAIMQEIDTAHQAHPMPY